MAESKVGPGVTSGTVETRPKILSGMQPEYPGIPTGAQKARRSGRISQEVPILLAGNDAEGHVFIEETHTVVISLHGAGVVSRHKLAPEQELILRVVGANREAEVRVVGQIAAEGRMHTYGVAFLNERNELLAEGVSTAGAVGRPATGVDVGVRRLQRPGGFAERGIRVRHLPDSRWAGAVLRGMRKDDGMETAGRRDALAAGEGSAKE